MKIVLTFFCILCFYLTSNAQTQNIGDYEVKVISYQYKTTKGHLKKVNAEGIGIEDYKGNYIIFRITDIKKIKVKKRGLTFGEAVGGGTLLGLGLGAGIWSLDESGESSGDMAKLTLLLTAAGATGGTIVGAVSEATRGRLTLKVNGSQAYFNDNFQRLEKYLNSSETVQHVNN